MSSLEDLFGVHGLVAVITGGGSGIGLMAAKALDAHGAKAVYVVGRRREKLQAAAKVAKNGTIIPLVGDVTSQASLEAMVKLVDAEQGYINVLFANAGRWASNSLRTCRRTDTRQFLSSGQSLCATVLTLMMAERWTDPLPNVLSDDYCDTLSVNLGGPYYTTLAFLELLNAGNLQGNVIQKSQVVVTASIAGFMRQPQDGWAYSTSKAGVIHLVKMMSTYFGPWNIRANCLAPGLYPSWMTANLPVLQRKRRMTGEGALPQEVVPTGRPGMEEDIEGAILFLMSRAGAYINGTVLVDDGGRLSQTPATY